ncbi:hypothetical protein HAX54_032399 [Datura stramonium]|uniref:Uncharacterized protein n=1 Tax=Datura stramonium TaxID=4076 RepID=A0ABS8SCW0_DATST|nr:hypothetical protein [Datura stramonium]
MQLFPPPTDNLEIETQVTTLDTLEAIPTLVELSTVSLTQREVFPSSSPNTTSETLPVSNELVTHELVTQSITITKEPITAITGTGSLDHNPNQTISAPTLRNSTRAEEPPIQHNYRETNQVTDVLVKEGSRMQEANSFMSWEVPPVFVADRIEADRVGTLFVKL